MLSIHEKWHIDSRARCREGFGALPLGSPSCRAHLSALPQTAGVVEAKDADERPLRGGLHKVQGDLRERVCGREGMGGRRRPSPVCHC